MSLLGALILIFVATFIVVVIAYVPITIAKHRNLSDSKIKIIKILSWVALITGGLTWAVAIGLALIYKPEYLDVASECKLNMQSISDLQMLADLKANGVITEAEFENKKPLILDQIK